MSNGRMPPRPGGAPGDLPERASLSDQELLRELQRRKLIRRKPTASGIGDEPGRPFDPEQRRYDIEEKSEWLPRIGVPAYPAQPTTQEIANQLAKVGLTMPAINWVMEQLCWCLRTSMLPIKNPSWIEPPVSSLPVDLFTPCKGVVLPPGSPSGALVDVLSFTVPERMVASFLVFGNEIEDQQICDKVEWTILREKIVWSPFYDKFTTSLGTIQRPEAFGTPMLVQPNQEVKVVARITSGNDSTRAFSRLKGFMFPIRDNTFDGVWPAFQMGY